MGRIIRRSVAVMLVGLLCGACDLTVWAQSGPNQGTEQTTQQSQPEGSQSPSSTKTNETPETSTTSAPSQDPADKSKEEPLPNAPSATQQQAADAGQSNGKSENQIQTPSGTAAATIGSPKGDLASRPAGVAIAPNEQHRGRALFIKLGLIVGAGVALGSVLALSQSSPAGPPGTH